MKYTTNVFLHIQMINIMIISYYFMLRNHKKILKKGKKNKFFIYIYRIFTINLNFKNKQIKSDLNIFFDIFYKGGILSYIIIFAKLYKISYKYNLKTYMLLICKDIKRSFIQNTKYRKQII